ncbi:MAG: class II aldolase/adducin family protein [Anaerolineae bacterium]|nr:class II aldolase/adducin family protein [Anaerolineae bacterium]NUQ04138.1 class II aldolase/adducin family protein [Anaerolineae bacterium]
MDFNLLAPREQISRLMGRLYAAGLTNLSGGNLSIKDSDGSIWITPSGIDKATLTPNDIMCLLPDGTITGPHKPSLEYPFHRAIYERRPDLRAVVHAHPAALVTFSLARIIPDTRIIPQAMRVCGRVGYAPYATPGSEALGTQIAQAFASGFDSVLLENHGAVAGGGSLLEAYQRMETLDFCGRTLLRARAIGVPHSLTDAQLATFDIAIDQMPEFDVADHSSLERELRTQIAVILNRACERQLMISTEGAISARLDESTFLITPTGQDRRSIANDALVLIRDGARERGKLPSRAVTMHQAIYARHSTVNAIITAQPPNATAYAVTAARFDTRLIPESYIMLRDVPLLPYGSPYTAPERVAETVSARNPVALIQNDAVLTLGGSVLQAFDRLEVLELSARALIDTLLLGELQPMDDAALEDLRRAFALE